MFRLRHHRADRRSRARDRAAVPDPDRAAAARATPTAEEERLAELFGEPDRWGDTLRPFLWTHASTMVTGFTGDPRSTCRSPCTYDFEVAAAKYLHALDDGEIPLVLLFTGTVFTRGDAPASRSSRCPGTRRRRTACRSRCGATLMDLYFPNSGWLRLRRDTLDALTRYKAERGLPTWDDAVEQLLKEAGE